MQPGQQGDRARRVLCRALGRRPAKGGGRRRRTAKKPQQEPNFGLSGALAKEANTVRGVELLHTEPPEARRPDLRWRLYVFKNGAHPLHWAAGRAAAAGLPADGPALAVPPTPPLFCGPCRGALSHGHRRQPGPAACPSPGAAQARLCCRGPVDAGLPAWAALRSQVAAAALGLRPHPVGWQHPLSARGRA